MTELHTATALQLRHTTTDVEMETLSGVQTRHGIPHDKYNVRSYAHACTYRIDD